MGKLFRSVRSKCHHLVGYIDAHYTTVARSRGYQTRGPTGATADVKHARISWKVHELNRLPADRAMTFLHAFTASGPGPLVKLPAKLFVAIHLFVYHHLFVY